MEKKIEIRNLDYDLYSAYLNNSKHKIIIVFQWNGKEVLFLSADDTVCGKRKTYDTQQEFLTVYPDVIRQIKTKMKRRKTT